MDNFENESDPLIPFLIKANNNQLTTEEHKSYLQVLRKRKQILNSTFTFSPEAVAKIERINTWLDKKYRSVIQQTDMLCAFAQVQIQKNAFINDYETDFTLEVYSPNKYSHLAEMDGIPVYSGRPLLNPNKQEATDKDHESTTKRETTLWLVEENHNEFSNNAYHPLRLQKHGWLLHELYDHTYLAWQDILDIEEIWLDMTLVTQHCDKIKSD